MRFWRLADPRAILVDNPRSPLDNLTVSKPDEVQNLLKSFALVLLHLDDWSAPMVKVHDASRDRNLLVNGVAHMP